MNNDKNLNNGFYEDSDDDFNTACRLVDSDFSHEELVKLLQTGNIAEKQIAALKFDTVITDFDAQILAANLTGCDGKIREAVALKIFQSVSTDDNARNCFAKYSAKTFADATIDINANICRLIIDSAALLKSYGTFAPDYSNYITKYAQDALNELDKFIYRDKKYVINKQLFKLYWCLEALNIFYDTSDEKILSVILEKCSDISEYTIREKTAKIVKISRRFPYLESKLKNDSNYYVKTIF